MEEQKVSESSSPPKQDSPPPILSLNEVSSSKQDQPCGDTPQSPPHSPRYSPLNNNHSPSHALPFHDPDTDPHHHKKPYPTHALQMKDYQTEPSSSSQAIVPQYPWHHPASSSATMSDIIPNPSLVPLLLPYPSLSHSVIYMSQYMNPFLPPCTGPSLAEKKKRNRTFIDPVSEVNFAPLRSSSSIITSSKITTWGYI